MEKKKMRLPKVALRDIRLVVCDMDGTALNREKEFSQETLEVWASLRKAGIGYTFASARTPGMLGVFCAQAGIENMPVITLEGALVNQWSTGETLYERPLELEAAGQIIPYCHRSGLDYTIYTSRRAYLRRDTHRGWRFEKYNALADRYGQEHVLTAAYEDWDLREILREKIYKIFIENAGPDSIEGLKWFLENLPDVRTDCSEGNSITVMHQDVSKGAALRALLPRIGLTHRQVCCFGDWYNDLDMLASFPHSVAMLNAVPEARNSARYVTGSNDENGVAYFINRWVLGKTDEQASDFPKEKIYRQKNTIM